MARCGSSSCLGRAALLAHVLFGLCLYAQPAGAQDFLQAFNATTFQHDLRSALDTALRCGAEADPAERARVADALLPMWRALQKDAQGRVQWRVVRYLAHRYFMRKSSLMIRGFEPTRLLGGSNQGVPDILGDRAAPVHLKVLLSSKHAGGFGFSLDDAARLVLVLERLVFESQGPLLAEIYRLHPPRSGVVGKGGLARLLEEYMVHWMMSGDTKGIEVLTQRPELREATFPQWRETLAFAAGQAKAVGFAREHVSAAGRGRGALRPQQFAFEDVHEVVGSITTSFASFWEPQCSSMKKVLLEMDPQRTGRVPLAAFYSAALESEWHFTESEAYLRELGALDESSEWRGKQVIIPNYVQAAPNCIITTEHYWLCCRNECEDIFGEIETAVGEHMASPEDILQVVGNMTAQETLDDDDSPVLAGALTEQLRGIATAHKGQVPLHGRLFAQWLHYAFPRQCPFPHRRGKAAAISPIEFGSGSVATQEEMLRHTATAAPGLNFSLAAELAANASADRSAVLSGEEMEWMSQWSAEEELLMDDGLELRAPWARGAYVAAGGVALLLALVLGATRHSLKVHAGEANDVWLAKEHLV